MNPSERWRSIALAPDEPRQRRLTSDRRKKRQIVAVACMQCRKSKAKCDGTRPRCNRCRDIDLTCQYDVAEGVSRAERIKIMERNSMNSELEDLKRIVMSLRSGTDDQAATILARLRLGELPEKVAKTLPVAAASRAVSGQLYSFVAQESTNTFGGEMSHELAFDPNEGTNVSQDSAIFLTSPTTQGEGCLPSANTSLSSVSLGKRKQSIITDSGTDLAFLVPLFDRDDYLLAKGEPEDKKEGREGGLEEVRIDPRLLQQAPNSDVGRDPLPSCKGTFHSQRLLPHRQHTIRSMYPSQLIGRQSIVEKIRIHPSLSINDFFGNMPLSSSIKSNHYPTDIQDRQIKNLHLPTWAMLPINTVPSPGSLGRAVLSILQEAANLSNRGLLAEQIIGTHPNVAALFNEDVFRNSPILCKWAVGMVHGMFLKGDTFTCFGYMYVFWYLTRWMIFPSPETYNTIPEWLRPSPNQLFMPHIGIVDFVVWPAFRELAVRIPAMQERMWWLLDMSINIECGWLRATGEALCENEETGQADLCDAAKDVVRDLAKWSVGPSFRGYVSNADLYVRIRTEGHRGIDSDEIEYDGGRINDQHEQFRPDTRSSEW